jgi:hydrogenase maturation protein HypF
VHARADTGLTTVALSGGVFQNALLLTGVCRALRQGDFTVLRHRIVPPNDGGLALGQLMIAATSAHHTARADLDQEAPPCA